MFWTPLIGDINLNLTAIFVAFVPFVDNYQ